MTRGGLAQRRVARPLRRRHARWALAAELLDLGTKLWLLVEPLARDAGGARDRLDVDRPPTASRSRSAPLACSARLDACGRGRTPARVNVLRRQRAQLERGLKADRCSIAKVLIDPPALGQTAKVADLLLVLPKYGTVKLIKVALHVPTERNYKSMSLIHDSASGDGRALVLSPRAAVSGRGARCRSSSPPLTFSLPRHLRRRQRRRRR